MPVYRRIYEHIVLVFLKERLLNPDQHKKKRENRGAVGMKNIAEKNPEEIAFLLLESPVKSYHVIDVEKKAKLEMIVRNISKKLAMVELLGYHIEVTINSHKIFTIKIARKDKDLDEVIYMKLWDPKARIKAIALGGWVTIKEKWYWGQYIVVDLSYTKTADEKVIFEFVKKLIQLVI